MLDDLIRTRIHRPAGPVGAAGRVLVIAADHTARGMLGVRGRLLAMADRADLLAGLFGAPV